MQGPHLLRRTKRAFRLPMRVDPRRMLPGSDNGGHWGTMDSAPELARGRGSKLELPSLAAWSVQKNRAAGGIRLIFSPETIDNFSAAHQSLWIVALACRLIARCPSCQFPSKVLFAAQSPRLSVIEGLSFTLAAAGVQCHPLTGIPCLSPR